MLRPPADIASDPALVAALIDTQHPEFAGPLVQVAEGWDNVIYRLGSRHVVRLPRREAAVALLLAEQRWLPELAPALPVAIPAPIAIGVPTALFPWPWSIGPWIEGLGLDEVLPAEADLTAGAMADTLLALHRPAPDDAPRNEVRGVPLRTRTERWAAYYAKVGLTDDVAALVEAALDGGLAASDWAAPPVWVHGDLHPANTVVSVHGDLAALIDFGDLCSGDPATDLAIAWTGYGAAGRAVLRDRLTASGAYGADVWARARAWAAGLSLAFLAHADDAPRMGAIARHAFAQLALD